MPPPHPGCRKCLTVVPDAQLAALAIEHGVEIASADTDFMLFPGLRWVNPLSG
jgi:predicted nucleic acid-binding protein